MLLYFSGFHDPEIACAPAGAGATRVSVKVPFTGGALGVELSVKSMVSVLPSSDT